ncbi:unnamed protein product [Calypogeia fissa]
MRKSRVDDLNYQFPLLLSCIHKSGDSTISCKDIFKTPKTELISVHLRRVLETSFYLSALEYLDLVPKERSCSTETATQRCGILNRRRTM